MSPRRVVLAETLRAGRTRPQMRQDSCPPQGVGSKAGQAGTPCKCLVDPPGDGTDVGAPRGSLRLAGWTAGSESN